MVTAGDIPEKLVVNLEGRQIGDVIHISDIELPEGTRPVITGRNFVIANISAPAGLLSAEDEAEEAEAEA
jgi:large subunit ribosomal protein L25